MRPPFRPLLSSLHSLLPCSPGQTSKGGGCPSKAAGEGGRAQGETYCMRERSRGAHAERRAIFSMTRSRASAAKGETNSPHPPKGKEREGGRGESAKKKEVRKVRGGVFWFVAAVHSHPPHAPMVTQPFFVPPCDNEGTATNHSRSLRKESPPESHKIEVILHADMAKRPFFFFFFRHPATLATAAVVFVCLSLVVATHAKAEAARGRGRTRMTNKARISQNQLWQLYQLGIQKGALTRFFTFFPGHDGGGESLWLWRKARKRDDAEAKQKRCHNNTRLNTVWWESWITSFFSYVLS